MSFADPSPWLAVFGRAHPVLLHAPLGILPAIAVLEFGAVLCRQPLPRGPVLALTVVNALAAATAAATGLVLAGEGGYADELLGPHKLTGLAVAALSALMALVAARQGRAPFRLLLALALAAMVPAGHLGGSITHGSDFLTAPLHPPAAKPQPTGNVYTDTIAPLLQRTCTNCHKPGKTKGELLLTTPDGIRKGGENGAVLVPGKPDESPLYTRCQLPIDADDHMPPEGKPQPTAEELAALRSWIAAGAPF